MTSERPVVIAAGTISLDTVEGVSTSAGEVLGGSGPYFAAAVGPFRRVGLLGVVGDDFPSGHLESLSNAGIDVGGVERRSGETFRWRVRYARDGSRETLGTNREVALRDCPPVPDAWRDARALFLGSTDPGLQRKALASSGVPDFVVLDTMTHWIQDRREEVEMLARSADVVLMNEEEAELFGDGDAAAGTGSLLEAGCSWVVVKRGEDGAIAFGHDRAIAVTAAKPSAVVDPTGAGDAFAGGLVSALVESWPDRLGMEEAMIRGSAAASLAIESFSVDRLLAATAEGITSRGREVRCRVRRHPRG